MERTVVRSVDRAVGTGLREGVGRPVGLPLRFGWLLQLVPYEAANFASQLRAVLAEPEMVALLAASPQAERALRPLCRMLRIEAAVLAWRDLVAAEPVVVLKVPVPVAARAPMFSDFRIVFPGGLAVPPQEYSGLPARGPPGGR